MQDVGLVCLHANHQYFAKACKNDYLEQKIEFFHELVVDKRILNDKIRVFFTCVIFLFLLEILFLNIKLIFFDSDNLFVCEKTWIHQRNWNNYDAIEGYFQADLLPLVQLRIFFWSSKSLIISSEYEVVDYHQNKSDHQRYYQEIECFFHECILFSWIIHSNVEGGDQADQK